MMSTTRARGGVFDGSPVRLHSTFLLRVGVLQPPGSRILWALTSCGPSVPSVHASSVPGVPAPGLVMLRRGYPDGSPVTPSVAESYSRCPWFWCPQQVTDDSLALPYVMLVCPPTDSSLDSPTECGSPRRGLSPSHAPLMWNC